MQFSRSALKSILPSSLVYLYRYLAGHDRNPDMLRFFFDRSVQASANQRALILERFLQINWNVNCPHTQAELLHIARDFLAIPPRTEGVFVECGCFKGGSTAKLSVLAKLLGRELFVFDSFEGIPENEEIKPETGKPYHTPGGWCGSLDEVYLNVSRWGEIDVCHFTKGWFDNTLPTFQQPIAGLFIDVDLASSTRTCLQYLYPQLVPGGVLYSHDGHVPPVVDVYKDELFWEQTVGVPKPQIDGLGKNKLIKIIKPTGSPTKSSLSHL